MPMGGGLPKRINSSGIVFNGDLIVPAAYKITVDEITETTPAHGVVMKERLIAMAME